MSGPFRFGPEELGATEGSELDDAIEAVRELELAAEDVPVRTGVAFTDRVMAALADEPSPAPIGFLVPLRRRGILAGFTQSVRDAWASLGGGRPALARAAALAYVLMVAIAGTSVVGAATFGAAGALGLLGSRESVAPTPEPSVAPVTTPSPAVEPAPSTEPSPSESPEMSEGPDDHGGGGAEPSDDHGGDSGSGGGTDDGSDGSGGSGPSATDDHGGSDDGTSSDDGGSGGGPTPTPQPTGTPKPSETPH